MPQMVIGKNALKGLDGSVYKSVMNFLAKLSEDDTTPGLRVKPLEIAVDPRVRTGRVNDDLRAVMVRLDSGGDPNYYLHGVWPHDEGNAIAARLKVSLSPTHGNVTVFETQAEQTQSSWSDSEAEWRSKDTSYVDESELTYSWLGSYGYTAQTLGEYFGMPDDVARRAMTVQTGEELFEYAEGCVGWIQDVLLALAAGDSKGEIIESMELDQPGPDTSGMSEDEALLAAMKTDVGRSQFAFADGEDELREIIEAGSFGDWRRFLHPEQRRYTTMNTNGPFRLSGAAGTGKTVVLVHRANQLATLNQSAKVILATFGRTLADGLEDQLKLLDPSFRNSQMGDNGIHVASVDALVHRAIANAQRRGKIKRLEEAMIDALGEVRSDLSSRQGPDWRDVVATAGTKIDLGDLAIADFVDEEYREVVLPNRIVDLPGYLRVRRPGRGFGLSRAQRMQVWKAIEQYRAEARITGGLTFAEAAAVAARLMRLRVAEGNPYYADSVLIDEGQDLSAVQWQFLRGLAPEQSNDMFIAEDSQQRIYGRQLVLSHYGIAIRGRSRRLMLNYRTTEENLNRAVEALEGGIYLDLDGNETSIKGVKYRSLRKGPKPEEEEVADLEEAVDLIAKTVHQWITDDGAAPETIGVLTKYRQQGNRVVEALVALDVSASLVDRGTQGDGVAVMTMHRAKGLEFSRVAMLVEAPVADDDDPRERSLQYVGMTRARDQLAIVTVQQR